MTVSAAYLTACTGRTDCQLLLPLRLLLMLLAPLRELAWTITSTLDIAPWCMLLHLLPLRLLLLLLLLPLVLVALTSLTSESHPAIVRFPRRACCSHQSQQAESGSAPAGWRSLTGHEALHRLVRTSPAGTQALADVHWQPA